ncbi:hypothetical protein [Paraferrimonas haliotis]|uniref:Uncharacterized protein n=1 Tax=Paraferrimonas haliotis TaxID=2013866 RepID=A0AA37TMS9_9GAMM|nr:hypothetical protein [Paraferrimonas haliotis]GLS83218.1 hypothetical protein GCM10007894_11950 [Paraferrimonas haliotis]
MIAPEFIAEVDITSETNTQLTEAKNMKQIVRRGLGHRWVLRIKTRVLYEHEHRPLYAQLTALLGRYGSFSQVIPRYSYPQNESLTDAKVRASVASGSTSIPLEGLPANVSNIITAGDFVTFDHSKVYLVVESANSNGQGETTIRLHTGLYETLRPTETAVFQGVAFQVCLEKDPITLKRKAKTGELLAMDLKLLERL